ncbi:MerR family transcriptional regulator [Halobacillus litoralis]|uniref:MerR family transcriptional regulator n=1 Tax=Halobacillus litoralis TaxID=45668 RepID=UPI001CD2EA52|nr:MerR family transcriptional regulator [Halobacillus litoralis]MCA0970884.1 MerR family transcriptional regulator [Halobacillus litoralis]
MEKRTFTTGEIANICNINKKTLFYYDQIDLLKPMIVKENGYRCYSYDQIDQLSKIKALQSVGFTLQEIKRQLSADNVPKGIDTLHKQKRKIGEKIQELVKVEESLNEKILELEHYQEVGHHHVFLKDCEEELLFVDRSPSPEGIVTNFLLDGYHFGIMMNVDGEASGRMEMNKFQSVRSREEANDSKVAGTYAGVYFVTDEQNIVRNARKAWSVLEESEYRTSGPLYLKDIATDFAIFEDGRIPFQITRKVEKTAPSQPTVGFNNIW